MDTYALLKLVHIISATFMAGTGLGTAFYMWRADRSGDVRAIAIVSKNVVLADWLFTTPSVIIQPITGALMIQQAGFDWFEDWIVVAFALYLLAGVCWLPVVWLQARMRDLAIEADAGGDELPALYHRYMRFWFWLGWPAFISVAIIYYLMVFKPDLF